MTILDWIKNVWASRNGRIVLIIIAAIIVAGVIFGQPFDSIPAPGGSS